MTSNYSYTLTIPATERQRPSIAWLLLALGALVMGGILTLLIVLARTPGVQEIIPFADFFHTAIVVHVDLTVLVFFLAFAGVLWNLNTTDRSPIAAWAAVWLAILGTVIFAVSPFLGAGEPLMNNYVPVLQDTVFLTGLCIFGVGFTVMVVREMLLSRPFADILSGVGVLRFGLYMGLLAALVSLLALAASYLTIPQQLSGREYYEVLFWGGGHILQFTHTLLMLVAWLWLATVGGAMMYMSPRLVLILLALGFLPVLITPIIYLAYPVESPEFSLAITRQMQFGGGIAAIPIGLMVSWAVFKGSRSQEQRPERQALLYSIILFAAGGIIGFLITGINVTIPAHYHGSIVGVTLAFMGVTYHLLPKFGFQRPSLRLASLQPAIYGGGQLLHIIGLAWSGGYGVQRKTAGAAQGLDTLQEIIPMGIMGLGGLISIIGGVLFLVIVFMAIWGGKGKAD